MPAATMSLFANRREAAQAYALLAPYVSALGPLEVEEKKTCLHVVAGRAAFLGVHPRRDGIRINLVLGRQLNSPRIAKSEQVSKSTFHNEVDIRQAADIDDELIGWLAEAYSRVTA